MQGEPEANEANFTYVVGEGGSVEFTNTSIGEVISFDWDFGDGSAHSTEENPTHIYATGGEKTVTLSIVGVYSNEAKNKTVTVPAIPILWWKGDDNTTETIAGLNGAWIHTAGYVAGVVNDAFNFTGANGVKVSHNDLINFVPANNFSIRMWFKTTNVSASQTLIEKRSAWGVSILSQKIYCIVGAISIATPTITEFVNNEWADLLVSYTGATGTWKVYFNSNLKYTSPGGQAISQTLLDMGIGCTVIGGADYVNLTGAIDELKIYNSVVTP